MRLAGLTDEQFVRRYKLSKHTFHELAMRIEPLMYCTSGRKSHRRLPIVICLSMTLRFLEGGQMYDIADMHGVAESTFYKVVYITCTAIVTCYELKLPRDAASLKALEEGFAVRTGGVMRGVVGALDGTCIRIKKPARRIGNDGGMGDCDDPKSYYYRKGFFAVNMQAIVDHNCKFVWASFSCPGSTHDDSTAFEITKQKKFMASSSFSSKYCLVADDAYSAHEGVVTPYPGVHLPPAKDAFNFWQSHNRILVECAFWAAGDALGFFSGAGSLYRCAGLGTWYWLACFCTTCAANSRFSTTAWMVVSALQAVSMTVRVSIALQLWRRQGSGVAVCSRSPQTPTR